MPRPPTPPGRIKIGLQWYLAGRGSLWWYAPYLHMVWWTWQWGWNQQSRWKAWQTLVKCLLLMSSYTTGKPHTLHIDLGRTQHTECHAWLSANSGWHPVAVTTQRMRADAGFPPVSTIPRLLCHRTLGSTWHWTGSSRACSSRWSCHRLHGA